MKGLLTKGLLRKKGRISLNRAVWLATSDSTRRELRRNSGKDRVTFGCSAEFVHTDAQTHVATHAIRVDRVNVTGDDARSSGK